MAASSPSPPASTARVPGLGSRLASVSGWALAGVLALATSGAYHAQLPLAGRAARHVLIRTLDEALQGSFALDSLENHGWQRIDLNGVVARDPQGRAVLQIERVAVEPDLAALWGGRLHTEAIVVRNAQVHLYPDDDTGVSIGRTFLPATESGDAERGGDPPSIGLDGIRIDGLTVAGDLPGYRGLRLEDVHLRGRVEVGPETEVRIYRTRGNLTGPYRGTTVLEQLSGFISSDMASRGIELYARMSRGVDRLRARFRLTVPDEAEAPAQMELRAEVDPWRASTLAEMGVAPGLDALRGSVRGHLRLHGPVDDLRLRADLGTEAGDIRGEARLPAEGPLTFALQTEDLALEELISAAPPARVSGRFELELDEAQRTLRAEVQPLTLFDVALPAFVFEGELGDDAVAVTRVSAPHAGGDVSGSGTVGYDGSVDVRVTAALPDISRDPNVRRFAPEARGSVRGRLRIQADEATTGLRSDGQLTFGNLRYGSVSAGRLTVEGQVGLDGPVPDATLRGEAVGLSLGSVALGDLTGRLSGDRSGYNVELSSRENATSPRLSVAGRARVSEESVTFTTTRMMVGLGSHSPWNGTADIRVLPGGTVELRSVRFVRGSESVGVTGVYRPEGTDRLAIRVMSLDLEPFAELAPEELDGLSGRLDGVANLSGDLDTSPRGELALQLRGGGLANLRRVSGEWTARLEPQGLQTEFSISAGSLGALSISGLARLDPSWLVRSPSRLGRDTQLDELTVRGRSLNFAIAERLGLGPSAPVRGRASGELRLAGSPDRPGIGHGVLVVDEFAPAGWDPLRMKLHLRLAEDRLIVRRGWVADDRGELGSINADLPFSPEAPPETLEGLWENLQQEPWSLSVQLAARSLDEWPQPARGLVPLEGLELSMNLTAEGDESGPRAELSAVAEVRGGAESSACHVDVTPVLTLEGSLEGGVAAAHLRGFIGEGDPEIRADLLARLPLDEWVRRGVQHMPPTEVSARARGIDLATVPYVCRYADGALNATLTLKDLLTPRAIVGGIFDSPELRLWERSGDENARSGARLSAPYRMHLRLGSSPERDAVTACALLGAAGEPGTPGPRCREATAPQPSEMITRFRLPVEWSADEVLPRYRAGAPITGWSSLSRVHLEPLLSLIPGIASGDAVAEGQLELSGPLEQLRLNGDIDLSEGHLQVDGLGQHLHDIGGHIQFLGDEILIPLGRPLRARDSGGWAELSGAMQHEALVPSLVELTLLTDEFPIRSEGMVLAALTGRAQIGGRIGRDGTVTTIRTSGFNVQLPERSATSLQPLEDHSEVLVVGSERSDGAGDSAPGYPITLRIDASRPFWVRRNDFSAQLSSELTAAYSAPELRVSGVAEIRRGAFEILGRRFELQRGSSLTFTGGPEMNPRVQIDALYEVPGRTGVTVTVEVTGTLLEPQIRFRSSETADPAEIIALLVSGSRRAVGTAEEEASEQATSFLTGLTTGVLTLGLREEFGEVIPLLAIERQGSGGTRVRMGLDANSLLPDDWRRAGVGAYVEGFLFTEQGTNAVGGSAGGGGVGGSISVELTFPYNILLRGTYVPLDNGSLDVLFEP